MENEDNNIKDQNIPDENVIILYARLGTYFSLSEEERPKYRKDLPLPDVAKDLTDKELYYVYKFLETYFQAITHIAAALSIIDSLPKERSEKVSKTLTEILKDELGSALDLYSRVSKDNA